MQTRTHNILLAALLLVVAACSAPEDHTSGQPAADPPEDETLEANTAVSATSPALVQVSAATPQARQSEVSVTYAHAQVAGDTNILAIGWNNATSTIRTVTDTAGNAYAVAVPAAGGHNFSQAIYYAKNVKASAAGRNTVTAIFDATTPFVDLRAAEYSGLDPIHPFDVGATASGVGASASSGTVKTTAPSALVFGAGITASGFSAAGTKFTSRIVTFDGDIVEDRIVTSSGTYGATAPLSRSAAWVMQVAAFRVAAPVSTPPPSTPPPAPPSNTPDPSKVKFLGDYSTGDIRQWPWILTRGYEGPTTGFPTADTPPYAVSVINDSVYGKAARFEVRAGDIPPGGGGQRAEFASNNGSHSLSGGGEGETYWYELALKFDPTFPANHAELGFGVVEQFKCEGPGSPPFGWYVDQVDDHFSLTVQKQSAPEQYVSVYSVLDLPLNRGVWHHITMRVKYSVSDTVGELQAWVDQKPQTFKDGTTVHHVRTLVPGSAANPVAWLKEGYYRDHTIQTTGVVYHAATRACTDKAGLTRPVF